ncbi:MAG: hypothetical protein Q9225_005225, partial [Loekoesia sp. 1 TL-2023]
MASPSFLCEMLFNTPPAMEDSKDMSPIHRITQPTVSQLPDRPPLGLTKPKPQFKRSADEEVESYPSAKAKKNAEHSQKDLKEDDN